MRVVAVVNGKGGVGKTTLSVNLADCLAEKGFKTALLDTDPQQSALWWSRPKGNESESRMSYDYADVTDARQLPTILSELEDTYKFAVVDTPPALYSRDLDHILAEAGTVLVPTPCDSMIDLTRAMETAHGLEEQGRPYWMVLNKVDSRSLIEANQARRELAEVGLRVFDNHLRVLKAYRVATGERCAVWNCKHPSAELAGRDMRNVMRELIEKLMLDPSVVAPESRGEELARG